MWIVPTFQFVPDFTLRNCQLFSWPGLNCIYGTAARLLKHFKDFLRKYVQIEDELDHFEEKFAIIIEIFLSKRLDLDPVQLFWIPIRPGQKVLDLIKSGSDWIRIHNTAM